MHFVSFNTKPCKYCEDNSRIKKFFFHGKLRDEASGGKYAGMVGDENL